MTEAAAPKAAASLFGKLMHAGRPITRRSAVHGIAAALLPFTEKGDIAVEAFQQHLIATRNAGLMNAVNMDTGYVNYLNDAEKQNVLRWTTEALGKGAPFVAGIYIEGVGGIRIEDDVAVHADRIEVLTRITRDLIEI